MIRLSAHRLLKGIDKEGLGYAGDFKQEVRKLGWSRRMYWEGDQLPGHSLCITGAGDSGYLQVIRSEIQNCFRLMGDKPDLAVFGDHLNQIVHIFYEKHIIPFAPFTSLELRVSLVVAAQSGDDRRLWLSNLSTVIETDLAIVGSGERFASTVIPERISRADGCGGHTDLISIRPKLGPQNAFPTTLLKLEKQFRTYQQLEQDDLGTAFGLPRLLPTGKWDEPTLRSDRLAELISEIGNIELFPPMPSDPHTFQF